MNYSYNNSLGTLDVMEVSIRHWEEALAAYYFIAPAEASSNLAAMTV